MERSPNTDIPDTFTYHEQVVSEYLKHSSVDKIIKIYNPPFSFAEIHRILDRWGIVKNIGRNEAKLSHILCFLSELTLTKDPIERLYKKMPPSFLPSMSTIHRVYRNVRDGVTRRVASALVLTRGDEENKILIGSDISTPRLEIGKPYGALSLPMTFSRSENAHQENILRIMQQEVFSLLAVKRKFPYQILPKDPKPFMYINVADIQVGVYHINVPREYSSFSSFKLKDLHFTSLDDVKEENPEAIRSGVKDIAMGYQEYLARERVVEIPQILDSQLNLAIMRLSY